MNNKVVLKIVVICASVFLVFGMLTAVFASRLAIGEWNKKGIFSIGMGEPFEYHKNENIDLDDITQININSVSANVVFYQSEDQLEVTLDCYGYTTVESITLETGTVDNIVNVKVKYPKVMFGSLNITESLLSIGIPMDYNYNIDVSGVSSKITMDGYLENSFKKFEVDTTSGNADIQCTQIDSLVFNSVSGELTINDTILGDVYADTTSGDVEINNITLEDSKVEINSVSGRAKIFYDVLCETKVHTTSGDVDLLFPSDSVIDLTYDSVSGDLEGNYSKNSDGVYVYVDTVSGDLNINKN